MPSLDAQRRILQARADRLERQLADVILGLDEGAIERLAQTALTIGFTRDEMEAVFGPALGRNLQTVYDIFAEEAATEAAELKPDVTELAARAFIARLRGLTDEGQKVVDDLVLLARAQGWSPTQLARELKQQLPLTAVQNGYVANFERKLREDRRLALRNKLRDRRFDRTLRGDGAISEEKLASMVERYRQNFVQMRARLVARQELRRAVMATNDEVYVQAKARGRLNPKVRKHWIHLHDDRVRSSHLAIPELNPDGVEVDAKFVTLLGELRYPLDPEGEPGDVIGCRCSLVYSGLPE